VGVGPQGTVAAKNAPGQSRRHSSDDAATVAGSGINGQGSLKRAAILERPQDKNGWESCAVYHRILGPPMAFLLWRCGGLLLVVSNLAFYCRVSSSKGGDISKPGQSLREKHFPIGDENSGADPAHLRLDQLHSVQHRLGYIIEHDKFTNTYAWMGSSARRAAGPDVFDAASKAQLSSALGGTNSSDFRQFSRDGIHFWQSFASPIEMRTGAALALEAALAGGGPTTPAPGRLAKYRNRYWGGDFFLNFTG